MTAPDRQPRDSQRSPRLAAWAGRVWRRPVLFGVIGLLAVAALAWPVTQLDTGMPSITVVPKDDGSRQGFDRVQQAFGPGAPGTLQVVAPAAKQADVARALGAEPGIASVLPAQEGSGGLALIQAVPRGEPSGNTVRSAIDGLREELPSDALVGGAVAENY